MLIAEDLLLLVTDDVSGRLTAPAAKVDLALGGATLLELTLMDKVDLSGDGDDGKAGRIVVRDRTPTGDEVLDAALQTLTRHQGKTPTAVIKPLSKSLRRTLCARLDRAGIVRAEQGRFLGVFPSHKWPSRDSRHEAEVRGTITAALVQATPPDTRTAALTALLHALGCEDKVVDARQCGLSKRQLRERAEEIANDKWAAGAVGKAIGEMLAAIVTSAAVTTAVLPGAS